jgi:hypothetical protein
MPNRFALLPLRLLESTQSQRHDCIYWTIDQTFIINFELLKWLCCVHDWFLKWP